jgi:hypothetical protein
MAIVYDNVGITMDSSALSTVLTTPFWSDRDLGFSRDISLPNLATWVYTANNPTLSSELARRTVRIRLDAKMEYPEDRRDWKHDPLRAWANENRGELVWAALTLVLAWVAAGRPKGERSMEDFKPWSNVMGGICEVAGVPGFLANRQEFREQVDYQRDEIYNALTAWDVTFKGRAVQVRELLAYPEIVTGFGVDPYSKDAGTMLGRQLHQHMDSIYRDLMVRKEEGATGGSARWVVVRFSADGQAAGRRRRGTRPTS